MKPELTDRQRHVLTFVYRYVEREGQSPSEQDIAEGCGAEHRHFASNHLRWLFHHGFIERTHGVARSIRVTRAGREVLGFPIAEGYSRHGSLLQRIAEHIEVMTPEAPLLAEIRKELAK